MILAVLKDLFDKQQHHLNIFYDQLNYKRSEQLLTLILESKGIVHFSGVGKSGFIAQKIVATLLSTGTKALFLPPVDALHGDLGMVSENDLVCLLSKSGETQELVQLIACLRRKKVFIITITSNESSCLAQEADFVMPLPSLGELCPFDLAPTLSTEAQLLFGDALAIALMQKKRFTLDQYASNHPHGQIGKRATIKVRDLMLDQAKTPLCHPEDRLEDILMEFTLKRCGCVVVVNKQKQLLGIFTDGDLRRALQKMGGGVLQTKLEELMMSSPKSIDVNALAWDAIRVMESDFKQPVTVLPVLDTNTKAVMGLIKLHDLVQAGI